MCVCELLHFNFQNATSSECPILNPSSESLAFVISQAKCALAPVSSRSSAL